MRIAEWIDSKRSTQREIFGMDPTTVGDGVYPDDPAQLQDYVRWNVLSVVVEAVELLKEFHWKPWVPVQHQIVRRGERDVALEIADAMEFLANVALAAGVSGEQVEDAINIVRLRSRARQREGDTGTNRCAACGWVGGDKHRCE